MPAQRKDEDWKGTLIKTTADELLDYLVTHEEASAAEIAQELDIEEDAVEAWAGALSESGLVETEYTMKGLILRIPAEGADVAGEKLDDVRKELAEKVKKSKKVLSGKEKEVEEARKRLEKLGSVLEKDFVESKTLKKNITELREEEKALQERLQKEIEHEERLERDIRDTMQEVERYLTTVKDAEKGATHFVDMKKEIEDDLTAIKKLAKHRRTLQKAEEKMNDVEDATGTLTSLARSVQKRVRDLFSRSPREPYDYILSGTVEEAQEELEDFDGDLDAVLKAEKNGDDRKTLIEYIEKKINEREEE